MNTDYLEGFQSATMDVTNFSLDLAKDVLNQVEVEYRDDYFKGYAKAIEMLEERLYRK